MACEVQMRSGMDRLRYTVTFELTLMAMAVPGMALFFDRGLAEMGLVGLFLSGKAMVVNLIYNWIFDRVDAHRGRVSSDRGPLGRILHAVGFETTLMITSLPIYMWWLGLSLSHAVMTDLVITSMVVVYTYLFTLAYDRIYPVGQPAT